MDKLKKQGSRITELIEKGREQGYLTYADVNDHLPEDISDPDQVDEIIGMINDLGLQVHETAPDEDALMFALDKGKLAYAALDVFTNEPNPSIHLMMHNNISLTPHIGAATMEAQSRIGQEMATQLIDHFNGQRPHSALN